MVGSGLIRVGSFVGVGWLFGCRWLVACLVFVWLVSRLVLVGRSVGELACWDSVGRLTGWLVG